MSDVWGVTDEVPEGFFDEALQGEFYNVPVWCQEVEKLDAWNWQQSVEVGSVLGGSAASQRGKKEGSR